MNYRINSCPDFHNKNRQRTCLACKKQEQNKKSIGKEIDEKLRIVTNYSIHKRLPMSYIYVY